MRILVISPTPTHPQDAGNRARIQALLAGLKAAGHSIHLCLLLREGFPPAAMAAMQAAWDEVIPVAHDRAREQRSLGALHALDDWILPEAEAAFAALAARAPDFDMVLVEYVFLSRALEFFAPGTVKVLDTHDVFGGRAEGLAALGLENRFFATTATEEARGLDRADLVLAIQAEEAALLAQRTAKPLLTLGHLPADRRPPLPPRAADGWVTLGWIGSANPLNTRALGRFLEALPPAMLAAEGGELILAGAAAAAMGLAEGPGLRLLGPVADADALYAQVDLVLNPHEGGTGLKIKTVEALARGRPVIGTAEAFAGLPAIQPFHSARDAADLAHHALRAVREPPYRARIATASAALFQSYAATTRNALAALAHPPALAALRAPPSALLVTDVPWWRATLGNHARIAALLAAARAEMAMDVFFAAPLTAAEQQAAAAALPAGMRLFGAEVTNPAAPPELPWGLTPFERGRFDGAVFAALAAHLARHPVQLLVIEYLRLSYLRLAPSQLEPYLALPGGAAPLLALDTHDIMSLRAQNFARFGETHFIQIGVLEELRILAGFHQVLAIQAEEAAWLEALLPGRVVLAPHTEPARPRARGSLPGAAPRIGFLGGDSPMNRDGLRWLLDQVWPAIAPLGAELHVAGGVCACMPEGRPGVVAHGEVADAGAFLDGLDIAVNPVFYGGGLKIKTVEYLARGLPSVLSAEALFGIAGGAGSAYALAEDRAGFVAGLARLVLDVPHRHAMAEQAQAFGRQHFGPAALAPAARLLAGLARGVPQPAPAAP
jgi:glycosyltransferase involved in cell wall biosynthesis